MAYLAYSEASLVNGSTAADVMARLPPEAAVARDAGLLAGWHQSSHYIDRLLATARCVERERGVDIRRVWAFVDLCAFPDEPSAVFKVSDYRIPRGPSEAPRQVRYATAELAASTPWLELLEQARKYLDG